MNQLSAYIGYAGFISQFAQEIEDSGGWEEELLAKIRIDVPIAMRLAVNCESTATFLIENFCSWSRRLLNDCSIYVIHAAALSHPPSLFCLGLHLALASEDSTEMAARADMADDALWLSTQAAELGDAQAQWAMGEYFSRMQSGMEEGLRFLGKSAAQAFTLAEIRLAELYANRLSFKNVEYEIKWLKLYAESGITDAKFELAMQLYIEGDSKSAFHWMEKAAEENHLKAQDRLRFFIEVEGYRRRPAKKIINYPPVDCLPHDNFTEETGDQHQIPYYENSDHHLNEKCIDNSQDSFRDSDQSMDDRKNNEFSDEIKTEADFHPNKTIIHREIIDQNPSTITSSHPNKSLKFQVEIKKPNRLMNIFKTLARKIFRAK